MFNKNKAEANNSLVNSKDYNSTTIKVYFINSFQKQQFISNLINIYWKYLQKHITKESK